MLSTIFSARLQKKGATDWHNTLHRFSYPLFQIELGFGSEKVHSNFLH